MYGVANSVQLTPGPPAQSPIRDCLLLPFTHRSHTLHVLATYKNGYLLNQRAALGYLDVRARSHSGHFSRVSALVICWLFQGLAKPPG